MHARLLRSVFLLLPIVACGDAEDESFEELFAEQDELAAEIGQAECESECAMASLVNSCGAPLDVSDEPLSACERDAMALDADGVRAWSECWIAAGTDYLDCLQSPTCSETLDYVACRDERSDAQLACELPVDVEHALEVCWGERAE